MVVEQTYPQCASIKIVTKDPDLWLEAVKGLLSCQPHGVQSYGATFKNNWVKAYMGGICVAQITNLIPNPIWVWVHVQQADRLDFASQWLDFVFDKKLSPWKDIVKTIRNDRKTIEFKGEKYVPGSLEFIKKYGFVVRTDWPANFLVNFIKATRMQHEYSQNYFSLWRKLTKDGINPALAALFNTVFTEQVDDQNYLFGGKGGGHWYADNNNMTVESPVMFTLGKPFKEHLSFGTVEKSNWNYVPCEYIWSTKTRNYPGNCHEWQDHLKALMSEGKNKKPKFTTTWLGEQAHMFSYEQVLKAAKLEEERVMMFKQSLNRPVELPFNMKEQVHDKKAA